MWKRLARLASLLGFALAAWTTINRLRRTLNPVPEHEPWPSVPLAPTRSNGDSASRGTKAPSPGSLASEGSARSATPSRPAEDAGGASPPAQTWVEPEDRSCPSGYPVKAKVRSGIYRLPDMASYESTVPDRCYPDEASAIADGLHKAHR